MNQILLSPEGKTLKSINFVEHYGAVPLAIRHHGELEQDNLENFRLSGGDTLLLSISQDRMKEIDRDKSFVIASEVGVGRHRPEKTYIVISIILGVVASAALNLIPIVVAAIIGVILMILTKSITAEEAYGAINWKVIMLLAGVIPLGTAMDKTGAADLLAGQMIAVLSDYGPRAVLSGFFLLTMGIYCCYVQ